MANLMVGIRSEGWIAGKFGDYRANGSGREVTSACGHRHRSRDAAEKCADRHGIDWEIIPAECQAHMPRK